MIFYKQCLMRKKLGTHSCVQTSWIPECFAHSGQVVKFRIQGNIWDDGWEVRETGANRLSKEEVSSNSRNHLSQAEASDMVRGSDGHWKKLGE